MVVGVGWGGVGWEWEWEGKNQITYPVLQTLRQFSQPLTHLKNNKRLTSSGCLMET